MKWQSHCRSKSRGTTAINIMLDCCCSYQELNRDIGAVLQIKFVIKYFLATIFLHFGESRTDSLTLFNFRPSPQDMRRMIARLPNEPIYSVAPNLASASCFLSNPVSYLTPCALHHFAPFSTVCTESPCAIMLHGMCLPCVICCSQCLSCMNCSLDSGSV